MLIENASRRAVRAVIGVGLLACAAGPLRADGGQVHEQGSGSIFLGYSIKKGGHRFDRDGDRFRARNGRYHDFRYLYLAIETGILPRVQAHAVLTYLHGCESFDPGAAETFCHDGGSDQWIGLKTQLRDADRWPIAVEATVRLPNVYMQDNETTGSGKHWLGIYRRDYSLILHTSNSVGSRSWFSAAGGYIFREGAPADVLVLRPRIYVPLIARDAKELGVSFLVDGYFSLGNESRADPVDDRFGNGGYEVPGHFFTFQDSDIVRPTVGIDYAFSRNWSVGTGYSRVAWGRNAHIYDEGWVQVGFRF